jgi:hypothetical protein
MANIIERRLELRVGGDVHVIPCLDRHAANGHQNVAVLGRTGRMLRVTLPGEVAQQVAQRDSLAVSINRKTGTGAVDLAPGIRLQAAVYPTPRELSDLQRGSARLGTTDVVSPKSY